MANGRLSARVLVLVGVILGGLGVSLWNKSQPSANAGTPKPEPTLATLSAELELVKAKLPDQAHAMQDVAYHYSNLWFAGDQSNWELAKFYWAETRSHLRWAVLLKPKRKDNAGKEIDLPAILQAVENAQLKQLEDAIKGSDKPAFVAAYRATLEMCYSCHKASDKPYLRPQIPSQPESSMIHFGLEADWPK